MRSLTQKSISKNLIAKILQDAFGDIKIEKIAQDRSGYFNTVYSIKITDRNRDVILRLAPPKNQKILRSEVKMMRREMLIYDYLKLKQIPIPEIIKYDFTHKITPRDYVLMEKLRGMPLSAFYSRKRIYRKGKGELDKKIALTVKKMHALTNNYFGYFDNNLRTKSTNSWASVFQKMVRDILTDAKETKVKLDLEKIKKIFEAYNSVFTSINTPHLVHWDLWPTNIFIDKKKRTVEAIIDWERAFWGDPMCETIFLERSYGKKFLKNYGLKKLDREEETRKILYELYYLIVLITADKIRKNLGHKRRSSTKKKIKKIIANF